MFRQTIIALLILNVDAIKLQAHHHQKALAEPESHEDQESGMMDELMALSPTQIHTMFDHQEVDGFVTRDEFITKLVELVSVHHPDFEPTEE